MFRESNVDQKKDDMKAKYLSTPSMPVLGMLMGISVSGSVLFSNSRIPASEKVPFHSDCLLSAKCAMMSTPSRMIAKKMRRKDMLYW